MKKQDLLWLVGILAVCVTLAFMIRRPPEPWSPGSLPDRSFSLDLAGPIELDGKTQAQLEELREQALKR